MSYFYFRNSQTTTQIVLRSTFQRTYLLIIFRPSWLLPESFSWPKRVCCSVWRCQAKNSGKFSDEELLSLKREFQHHKDKIHEYNILMDTVSRTEGELSESCPFMSLSLRQHLCLASDFALTLLFSTLLWAFFACYHGDMKSINCPSNVLRHRHSYGIASINVHIQIKRADERSLCKVTISGSVMFVGTRRCQPAALCFITLSCKRRRQGLAHLLLWNDMAVAAVLCQNFFFFFFFGAAILLNKPGVFFCLSDAFKYWASHMWPLKESLHAPASPLPPPTSASLRSPGFISSLPHLIMAVSVSGHCSAFSFLILLVLLPLCAYFLMTRLRLHLMTFVVVS